MRVEWLVLVVGCAGEAPSAKIDSPPQESVETDEPDPTDSAAPSPGLVSTVLGLPGLALNNGTEGEAENFGLHLPTGIELGNEGEVYVADESNHRIVALHPNGMAEVVAGNGYIGDTPEGPLAGVPLHGPSALAFLGGGPLGTLLVATRGTCRIVEVDLDAKTVTWIAGTGDRGYNGEIAASQAKLAIPRGVTTADDGTIYISDTGNHLIRKIDADGRLVNVAGQPHVASHSGDGGLAMDATLNGPIGLAIQGDDLYFADSGSHTVRHIDLVSGILSNLAGVPDTPGSDAGESGPALFNYPAGISFDGTGGLLVAEQFNQCIRRVDLSDGEVTTFAGQCGAPGFSGDGGPPLDALLFEPMAVTVGADGIVWVTDTGNEVIRTIQP